jgi:hypothetical protein
MFVCVCVCVCVCMFGCCLRRPKTHGGSMWVGGEEERGGRGANAQVPRTLAVCSQAKAAPGLQVMDDGATCTKIAAGNAWGFNVRLERPSADAAGAFTVTWQCVRTGGSNAVFLGWGQPNLGLTDPDPETTSGSFVYVRFGYLSGIGTKHGTSLDRAGMFEANDTLSLVYRPGAVGATAGTLHASRQGAAPQLIFSGLAHDLVPVACFCDQGASWRVVG